MAYDKKTLSRTGGVPYAAGDSKSIFAYASADSLATIAASGYFNNATKRLKKGDIIFVTAGLGGAVETGMLVVSSASGAATVTTKGANEGALGIAGVAAGYKVARGQHTTVADSDTVVTGLATVVAVVVQLDSDPVDGCMHVTASIGDQAGAPAAGSILIKSWKSTDGDASLIAGTTFSKKVNWVAIGT